MAIHHAHRSAHPTPASLHTLAQVEGSDRALYSYAKFTHDPNAEFDPLTVKEVHTKMSEQEAASYGR